MDYGTTMDSAMERSVLKMKFVAFPVHLHGHSKEFCYTMVYGGGGHLLCTLMISHYFKHIKIGISHCGILQGYYCILWYAYNLSFIYRYLATEKNQQQLDYQYNIESNIETS